MALYRYHIIPQSGFATPLRSDTLYGHLLWVAAEWQGEAAVKEMIEKFAGDQPPFKLSSAFPSGTLPMPQLPGIPRDRFAGEFKDHGDLATLLGQFKQFRKQAWLPLESWLRYRNCLSQEALFADWLSRTALEKIRPVNAKPELPFSEARHQPHNSIDRRTGAVKQEGGLHFTAGTWYRPNARLDLYVETDRIELFEDLFMHLAITGYGADRTTGKGQFSFVRDNDFDPVTLAGEGSHRLSLSLCSASDPKNFAGLWKPLVKHGRAWSGHGERNPFKKPFFAFAEGSLFHRMPNSGYLLRGIHSNPEVVQVTWPATLPATLEGSYAG